jgi:chemotaxis protein methyltransferase CheR
MKLTKYTTPENIVQILVTSIDSKSDIKDILNALSEDAIYEISLLNIKILPAPIIIRLHELKEKVTIVVNTFRLKYYLRDLGFYVNFQHNKYINKTVRIAKVQYLAMGGSAGSLKKFIQIIQELPSSSLSIFIVMHQKSDVKSSLAEILQRHTSHYIVKEAISDTKVMPSTIYVAPPNRHMIVAGGFIFLTDDEPKHFSKPSISNTFESLAYEYKDSLLAILVCGYGADGSDSLEHIRKTGGTVIIEQPYECKATPMLENALKTREYDYILSIEKINKLLYNHLNNKNEIDMYLDKFLDDIYIKYGYDYKHYNKNHIRRRISHYYNILEVNSFREFSIRVLNDKDIFKDLFLDISINVTTFFRNPQTYKVLKEDILSMFKERDAIKIWCAGCSSGEEPYSIAIFLKELGILDKSLIYATDLNDIILQHATNGIYSNDNYKLFEEHYIEAGGEKHLNDYFKDYGDFNVINADIKEKILFFRHNLATDGVLNEFQLVFCRNVIIYFDETLKTRVFNLFDDSLQKDGILVLGESESLDRRKNFITLDSNNKIYKKLYE